VGSGEVGYRGTEEQGLHKSLFPSRDRWCWDPIERGEGRGFEEDGGEYYSFLEGQF
jgi:hypothetical protein